MKTVWELGTVGPPTTAVSGLEPIDVLIDVDGPRLFVAQADVGKVLVYQCGESAGCSAWLVVPTDEQSIARVRSGRVPLLDALHQPWSWIVLQEFSGKIAQARVVSIEEIPREALPASGVTLQPPFLAVRAVGPALPETEVPASVVRRVVDGALHTMKALVERALAMQPADGRPTERIRRYYDLPTQQLSFGSFEAVFGEPAASLKEPLLAFESDALARAGELLRRGIVEVQRTGALPDELDDDLVAAVDALQGLVPPASGPIAEVRLRGKLIGAAPVRLTREQGSRARKLLRQARPSAERIELTGAVRELDKDKMTFIVRPESLADESSWRFSAAQRDDVETAFAEDYTVSVAGWRRKPQGPNELVTIEPVGDRPGSG